MTQEAIRNVERRRGDQTHVEGMRTIGGAVAAVARAVGRVLNGQVLFKAISVRRVANGMGPGVGSINLHALGEAPGIGDKQRIVICNGSNVLKSDVGKLRIETGSRVKNRPAIGQRAPGIYRIHIAQIDLISRFRTDNSDG